MSPILSIRGEAAALCAAILLAASSARADGAPEGAPDAAEASFRAGRELVAAGNYAEGCPKFEQSFALSPSTGTLLNIAKCHEHDGKIASAWEDYRRALVLNEKTKGAERQKALEDLAKKGLADLEPRLPRLRVVVPSPPLGLKVLHDGKELDAASLGEALPADPGPHEVSATAPGYRAETRQAAVEIGKTVTVEIALVAEAKEAKETKPGVPAWAWVSLGGGVALAGAGVFFLTQDLAAINALKANCYIPASGLTSCRPGYQPGNDDAKKDRSLPLFIGLGGAGLAAIGAAVVGFVRTPSKAAAASASVTPWIGPGVAGLSAHGGF